MHETLAIRNIGRIFCGKNGPRPETDSAVFCENGTISWIGPQDQCPTAQSTIDAKQSLVTPGFVDCHTHLVFGGERSAEFVQRISGVSYEDIAKAGGGIWSTVKATRNASEDELYHSALSRLDKMLALGVTSIEAKSGYGLDLATELKILRTLRRLQAAQPIEISPTFLGGHSVPPEYKTDRRAYIKLIVEQMIPAVADEGLAQFCDVFCEQGVFDLAETREILAAGTAAGLRSKVHAEQLHTTGGARLAAELGAISADHLERIDDAQIAAMADAETVAVLLPAATLFLGSHRYAPARRLLDAGVEIALATDLNPGSSMTHHLPLMTTLAAVYMQMTPAESLRAITFGGAKAIDRPHIGRIAVGAQADLLVTAVEHERKIPYLFADNVVTHVLKKGRVVCKEGKTL